LRRIRLGGRLCGGSHGRQRVPHLPQARFSCPRSPAQSPQCPSRDRLVIRQIPSLPILFREPLWYDNAAAPPRRRRPRLVCALSSARLKLRLRQPVGPDPGIEALQATPPCAIFSRSFRLGLKTFAAHLRRRLSSTNQLVEHPPKLRLCRGNCRLVSDGPELQAVHKLINVMTYLREHESKVFGLIVSNWVLGVTRHAAIPNAHKLQRLSSASPLSRRDRGSACAGQSLHRRRCCELVELPGPQLQSAKAHRNE
jgi:hypothetical protein